MIVDINAYKKDIKYKTYDELLIIRDELIIEIKEYEDLFKAWGDIRTMIYPPTDEVYLNRLEQLEIVVSLIHQKYSDKYYGK